MRVVVAVVVAVVAVVPVVVAVVPVVAAVPVFHKVTASEPPKISLSLS